MPVNENRGLFSGNSIILNMQIFDVCGVVRKLLGSVLAILLFSRGNYHMLHQYSKADKFSIRQLCLSNFKVVILTVICFKMNSPFEAFS